MNSTITIATFENVGEAEILRQELIDCGVAASLSDDATAVALWHVGSALGGVRVQINAADKPIALKIIAERQRRRDRNAEANDWYCGQCREWISPSFDICWSCRGARDDVQDQGRQPEDPAAALGSSTTVNQPHKPAEADPDAEAAANRAWRASILGWAICPPIALPPLAHIYSTWISSKIDSDLLEPATQRRLGYTMLSNWLAFATFAIVLASVLWSIRQDADLGDPPDQAPPAIVQ